MTVVMVEETMTLAFTIVMSDDDADDDHGNDEARKIKTITMTIADFERKKDDDDKG